MYLLRRWNHINMWGLNKNNKYKSKFNKNLHIGKLKGNTALFSGGVTQSGGELIEMWDCVNKRIKKESPNAKKCLILGVAGGTCISSITKISPKIKILGIELDRVMIDIYNEQFRKDDTKLELINDDALKWIKQNIKTFDVIIVDLFIGRQNPKLSRNKAFIKNVLKSLNKNGIVIFNSHYDKKNPIEFERFRKLTEVNFHSEIIYEFPLNKMVLLTQRGNISKNLNKKL